MSLEKNPHLRITLFLPYHFYWNEILQILSQRFRWFFYTRIHILPSSRQLGLTRVMVIQNNHFENRLTQFLVSGSRNTRVWTVHSHTLLGWKWITEIIFFMENEHPNFYSPWLVWQVRNIFHIRAHFMGFNIKFNYKIQVLIG